MVVERDWQTMQDFAVGLPCAERFCTDELAVYGDIMWPPDGQGERSSYVISYGKEQTYTIEGVNADLRTYLGRLKRRSRCFSRCIEALRRAMRLFVWHYNRRQRAYLANPILKGSLPLRS